MQNLLYFYIISHKNPHRITAGVIYNMWGKSKILREYERPEKMIIRGWVNEIKAELIEKGIKLKIN